MAGFKVAYRADASLDSENRVTWETGCPLQFEVIQISRNTETSAAYLQGKLRNVSDQTVRSFKASITVEYEDGATEDALFEPLDADVAAGAAYELAPIELKQGNATGAAGVVESAKLEDGAWQSASAPAPLPIPAPIGLSDAAVTERRIQIWGSSTPSPLSAQDIKAAAANRVEEHDGWWLCPCGQVNVGRSICAQCNASLETLREPGAEDEGALTAAAEKRARAKAQKEAEQAAQAAEHKERLTKKLKVIIPIIAALLVILIALLWFLVIGPKVDYDSAIALYDEGEYSEAYDRFTKLGNYEQSEEWADKAFFQMNKSQADELLHNGELISALEIYEQIKDHGNYISPVLASMADYVKAHPTKDDSLTIDYLDILRRYDYEDSDLLLGLVYPWTYEFSLTSSKAFKENDEQWTTASELTPKEGIGYSDSGVLLIRAKCENPDGRRDLELTWETRKAGSVFASENGVWSQGGQTGSKGRGAYEVEIWGDDKIYSFPFPDLYCDAWRVTVTDPLTNEVLFTGEIYQAQ